jgi:putative membrane protein
MMTRLGLTTLALRWLMLAFAVWVAAELIEGIHLDGWESTLLVAAILGLLNLYLRPILVFFSIPATILTLGLFLVVINALLLGLTDVIASLFDFIHFDVDDVGAALLGAVVVSLVGLVLGKVIDVDRVARNLTGGY